MKNQTQQKPLMEMSAIWLNSPVIMPNGEKKSRMIEGMEIAVNDGWILSGVKKATHTIVKCEGTLNSSCLEMVIKSIPEEKSSRLKLK